MSGNKEPFPMICPEEGKEIGRGATSTVYLLPDATVCKVFLPGFSQQEILRESRMAESAYRLGISVPKPYGLVCVGERLGIRSEYIAGESLAETLEREPERYEELLAAYLRALRQFHETRTAPGDFVSAGDLYLEKLDRLHGTGWYTEEELKKMEAMIRSIPERDTLVYGDYHPRNILVKEGRLFFVDLGDTCCGHPVYDWAMIANTHFIIPSVNPAYAKQYFTVSPERMLRLWQDLPERYFAGYGAEQQHRIRKGIMALSFLRQGLSPADAREFPEYVLKANVTAAKKQLLPEIDRADEWFDW